MTDTWTRREFVARSLGIGPLAALAGYGTAPLLAARANGPAPETAKMRLGLVTYLWARNWPLPTLLANCRKAGIGGVELRTTHKHGVERTLSAEQRAEVKKRFADSGVVHVGIGSNERFDHPDPKKLAAAIEATKAFVRLSHDTGGSGVKVKPNSFHKNVPHDKTIEQIGRSLNVVGRFAANLGQQIRLEVHGQCCKLPIMKQIMDVATDRNVAVCWNSNAADLAGEGLEHNFNLVKDRFGATAHVRAFDNPGNKYPWQELIGLLVKMDYAGWVLLEASSKRKDYIAALARQKVLFAEMIAKARQ